MIRKILPMLFLLLSSNTILEVQAEVLPIKAFASLPDTSSLSLSPNGEKLVSLTRIAEEGNKGIAVELTTLSNGKKKVLLFTDNSKHFIHKTFWKDNKTLLVTTYYPDERDTTLSGMFRVNFKTREFRLFIIDTETGNVSTPFKKSFLKQFRILPSNLASVVDVLPDDPEHILMSLPAPKPRTEMEFYARIVHKVNIINKRHTVAQNRINNINSWQTDRQHNVRVGQSFKDGIVTTHIKDLKTGDFRELWPYKFFSEDEVQVKGFGQDPNELFISAYHNKKRAIFKVNLTDPDLKRELVYASENYDVNGYLIYSSATNDVIGVSSLEDGGTVFFDEDLKKIQSTIDIHLKDSANYIYSLTDDMNSYLLYSTGDVESGTYYLGQRKPSKLQAITYRYNSLPPEKLVKTEEYHYKARDGLAIQGNLTLPNVQTKKNLPTIMFPHGGPQARDSKAFDYWVQFFANKGYAVLQMNFRGSDGQGITLRDAGMKGWGKEMQNDIEDGAKQLIAEGITNPNKVCIVGASYGGYAALMGVVKTPDFYKCAISVAGVSSVYDIVRDNRNPFKGYNIVEEQVGKLGSHLHKVSPVTRADEIKVPVLLIHGDSDVQVEVKHSRNMHEELESEGKDVIYIELPNEDHYLANEENRITTFKAMSDFLDKNLPIDTVK